MTIGPPRFFERLDSISAAAGIKQLQRPRLVKAWIPIGWLPEWGLSLENIRHAHSHLMFFGWAVPLPFLTMRNSILRGRGIGAPLTFPYGISETLLSPSLLLTARLGGAVAALGLLQAFYAIGSSGRRKDSIWIWPLALVGLKALMQLTASVIPSSFLFSDHGLRIFYLHVLLLGAFTLAIMAWWHRSTSISDRFFNGIALSIVIVLVSLLLPTCLWPAMWTGSWIFYLLAAAALLPVLAIGVYWFKMIQSQNNIR